MCQVWTTSKGRSPSRPSSRRASAVSRHQIAPRARDSSSTGSTPGGARLLRQRIGPAARVLRARELRGAAPRALREQQLEHRRRGPRPLPVAGDVQDPHAPARRRPRVAAPRRAALELPQLRVLEQHVEGGDRGDQEARHAIAKARLQHVGAQETRRRPQAQVRHPRATPSAVELLRLDAAVLLHARDLIGEVDVAVVLEIAREPLDAAGHAHAPVRVAARPAPARAPECAQLPVGVEVAVADPAAEMPGDPVQLDAVERVAGAREPLAQAQRRARARGPRRRRARSPNRAWPGRARNSSDRRFPRRRAAAPGRPSAARAPRCRRSCARRPRRRSRRSRRARPGSARCGARRRGRSRRR